MVQLLAWAGLFLLPVEEFQESLWKLVTADRLVKLKNFALKIHSSFKTTRISESTSRLNNLQIVEAEWQKNIKELPLTCYL